MTVTGLWIDDAPRLVLTPRYWDSLASLNIKTAAIMVDTLGRGWDPKWSAEHLAKVGQHARERQIELVLTSWPDPVKGYIDAMAAGMGGLIAAAGAAAWEIDTEFNWVPGRVQGFRLQQGRSPLDLAGDYLMEQMLAARAPRCKRDPDPVVADAIARLGQVRRLELTTFTSHTENGRAADLAPHMDRLVVQAYSVRNRTGQQIPWEHTYGPGRMQIHTLDRTALVPGVAAGKVEVAIGLASYDQHWPGHRPDEAMRIAIDAALARGVVEIRFWSSKWVVGPRKSPYAARIIRQALG